MKAFTAVLALFAAGTTLVSASPHDSGALAARHAALAKRQPELGATNNLQRRCKKRPAPQPKPSTDKAEVKDSKPDTKDAAANTKATTKPTNNKAASSSSGGVLTGSSSCGGSGATQKTTATSGPNGNIDFFNCGMNGGGWNPPHITVDQIKAVDLSSAVKQGGSPFTACGDYIQLFEQYAGEHGLPAILLASFAMQESSCKASTVGPNGEQGLMQLTTDKCGGAPGGNCRDPAFNIRTGASYFAKTLNEKGGNILLAIGQYNGFFKGMTIADATRAASQGHCFAQNNLDYLQQFLNGWCQNINVYNNSFRIGKYFNLDKCN